MDFQCLGTADGRLDFGKFGKPKFQQFLKDHPGIRLVVTAQLPESGKLRRFYHGAVIPLWAYLDGKDYRDHQVLAEIHELAKIEFNGQIISVGGKSAKIGKSTKGEGLRNYVNRIIDYLEEQYAIDRALCLDTKDYKYFRDAVFMDGEYDTYVDYLVALRKVPVK